VVDGPKGNVVVEKSDGKTLYTQQLFWNARTKKIYSNVDSKIVQNNGRDVFIGEGFESDEEFKDWRFRRMKGRMEVELKQSADSAATDSTSVRPVPKPSDSRPSDSRPSDSRSAVRTSESGRAAPAREIPAGPAERQVGRPEAEVERRPLKMRDGSREEARPVLREEQVPSNPNSKTESDAHHRRPDRRNAVAVGFFLGDGDCLYEQEPSQAGDRPQAEPHVRPDCRGFRPPSGAVYHHDPCGQQHRAGRLFAVDVAASAQHLRLAGVGAARPERLGRRGHRRFDGHHHLLRRVSPQVDFQEQSQFLLPRAGAGDLFFLHRPLSGGAFTTQLSHGILHLLGRRVEERNITPSFDREDLAALLDSNSPEQHSEPDNELKLFQNALDFADLRVRDCMVPRVDVEAVDIDDTSIEQLTARFVDSKYSRIFVWRKSIDNIVGYVNSKSPFHAGPGRSPT